MDANEFTEIHSNSYFNIGYQGWANTVRIFEKLGYLTIFPGGYFEAIKKGYLTKLKISDKFKELVDKFKLIYQDILKRTSPISLKDSKDNEIKVLNSKRTNPIYKNLENEQMPTNYCQYFWECPHCKKNLKPKEGDCCIYCSYGNTKCPSIQKV